MRPAQAEGERFRAGITSTQDNGIRAGRSRGAHLARGSVEMCRGNVEKVVLYEVQERWHAHEHRVSPVDYHTLPNLGKGSSAVLPQHHQKGGRNLCRLCCHDCS